MMKKFRQMLASFLVAATVFSFIPANAAFAAEEGNAGAAVEVAEQVEAQAAELDKAGLETETETKQEAEPQSAEESSDSGEVRTMSAPLAPIALNHDSVSVAEDGTVTLNSDHFAKEGVQTMSLRISVVPAIEGADISFAFDSGVKSLIKQAKDTSSTVITLYLAGGNIMSGSETSLKLGKISVTKGGEAVAANVSIAADGLSYVQGGSSQVTATIDSVSTKMAGKEAEDLGTVDLGIDMSTSFTAPASGVPDDWFFNFMSSLCAFPGGQVTYCFKAYNTHISKYNVKAHNVVLKDVIPEGFTVARVSGAGKYEYDPDTRTATWTFDTISGTQVKNASTVYLTLNIPSTPTQAGWNNYATASADNGNEASYRSKPAEVGDEYQENLYYAYCLTLDSNGGTDNADGLPYFFFRLNNIENGKTNISDDPAVTIEFPGDWYVGYTGSSYGGDPEPDAGMGDKAIFAGWSTEKHTGVQTKKPSDMVAYIENGSIHGSYTFTGLSTLYAVWANDNDGDGNPDWEKAEPADLTRLNDLISRASDMDSSLYSNWNETVEPALRTARGLAARVDELTKDDDQDEVDDAAGALESALQALQYRNQFTIDSEGNITLKTSQLGSAMMTGFQLKIYVDPAFSDDVTVLLDPASFVGDPYVSAKWNEEQGCINMYVTATSLYSTLMSSGETELRIGKLTVKTSDGQDVKAEVTINAKDFLYLNASYRTENIPMPDAHAELDGIDEAPCKHQWGTGTVKKAATCLEDGLMEYSCEICGETKQENIKAPGHHTITSYTHATGDGADATHSWECDVCGETGSESCSFEKTGSTEADCLNPATETFTCEKCGFEYTANKPGSTAKGHTVVDVDKVDATCTEDGMQAYHKCSVCGFMWTDDKPEGVDKSELVISATGHIAAPERKDAKEPTCTEDGSTGTVNCTVCGAVIFGADRIPALGHDWGDGWKHESDRHIRQCSRCFETEIVMNTYPSSTESVVNAKEPTCTENGYTGDVFCSLCDKIIKQGEDIPALGHDMAKAWSHDASGHWFACSRCSEKLNFSEHSPSNNKVGAKKATCSAEGYTGDTVCSVCGEVIEKGTAIPKTSHNYVNGKCSICGESQSNQSSGSQGKGPKTGDNISMWLALLFGSVCVTVTGSVAAANAIKKRRSSKSDI